MATTNNYPPGVTGNEIEISGPTWSLLEDELYAVPDAYDLWRDIELERA